MKVDLNQDRNIHTKA